MRRFAVAVLQLMLVTAAWAYMMVPLDVARHEGSLVVVGTSLDIADAGRREISFPGLDKEHWLFAHSVARVAVHEVVKAPAGVSVAVGDTIDIYFCTSDEGFRPGATRAAASISDVVMPAPPVRGEIATYCASVPEGEARFLCRLSDSDLQQLRSGLLNASGSTRK